MRRRPASARLVQGFDRARTGRLRSSVGMVTLGMLHRGLRIGCDRNLTGPDFRVAGNRTVGPRRVARTSVVGCAAMGPRLPDPRRPLAAVAPLAGTPVRLFLTSATILFVELLLIRWIPANVKYIGFFSNFLLMASFLGIGLGILLGRRGRRLVLSPFAPLLLVTVDLVYGAQLNIQFRGRERDLLRRRPLEQRRRQLPRPAAARRAGDGADGVARAAARSASAIDAAAARLRDRHRAARWSGIAAFTVLSLPRHGADRLVRRSIGVLLLLLALGAGPDAVVGRRRRRDGPSSSARAVVVATRARTSGRRTTGSPPTMPNLARALDRPGRRPTAATSCGRRHPAPADHDSAQAAHERTLHRQTYALVPGPGVRSRPDHRRRLAGPTRRSRWPRAPSTSTPSRSTRSSPRSVATSTRRASTRTRG